MDVSKEGISPDIYLFSSLLLNLDDLLFLQSKNKLNNFTSNAFTCLGNTFHLAIIAFIGGAEDR
jgi:hypothetical protein